MIGVDIISDEDVVLDPSGVLSQVEGERNNPRKRHRRAGDRERALQLSDFVGQNQEQRICAIRIVQIWKNCEESANFGETSQIGSLAQLSAIGERRRSEMYTVIDLCRS